MEQNRAFLDELKEELFDHHALSLHLPIEPPCEFHVQSEAGPTLSFRAGTEAIIVTVGKQIEVTPFYFFHGIYFQAHIYYLN